MIMTNHQKQKGFSLFLVLILMLVIALLVIVTAQSSNTELRMSSNESDRKFALSLAENGLRAAEDRIKDLSTKTKTVTFTANCTDGYCLPASNTYSDNIAEPFAFGNDRSTVPAWQRCANNPANTCQSDTVLDVACNGNNCQHISNGDSNYIIEYLGSKFDNSDGSTHSYFRVTSRAHGKNSDTVVTLQSYLELHAS